MKTITVKKLNISSINKLQELGYTIKIQGTETPKPQKLPYERPKMPKTWEGKLKRNVKLKQLEPCTECNERACTCTHVNKLWHKSNCDKIS